MKNAIIMSTAGTSHYIDLAYAQIYFRNFDISIKVRQNVRPVPNVQTAIALIGASVDSSHILFDKYVSDWRENVEADMD